MQNYYPSIDLHIADIRIGDDLGEYDRALNYDERNR